MQVERERERGKRAEREERAERVEREREREVKEERGTILSSGLLHTKGRGFRKEGGKEEVGEQLCLGLITGLYLTMSKAPYRLWGGSGANEEVVCGFW